MTTTLREKLIEIGAKVTGHARYFTFPKAETMLFIRLAFKRLQLAAIISFLIFILPAFSALAQSITREEAQKIEAARAVIAEVETEQEVQEDNFNGLLALREKLEPAQEDLRAVVGELQQRLAATQAQLAELGPPTANATEDAPNAIERRAKQALVLEIEQHMRGARAQLVRADQLWNELTDARRELFSSRLLQNTDSFIYPRFWQRLFSEDTRELGPRWREKRVEVKEAIDQKGGWPALGGIVFFAGLMGIVLWRLHHWLATRRRAAVLGDGVTNEKAILNHALTVLAIHAMPFVAVSFVIWAALNFFDLVPEEVQYFLLGVAGALAVYGIGTGAVYAVFAPTSATHRVIRADDGVARRITYSVNAMLAVYLLGLVGLGVVQMLSARVSLTVAITGIIAALVVVTGALLIRRHPEQSTPAVGLIAAPLNLLRPVFVVIALTVVGSLLLGFIALSGFVVGRALATVLILCVATLIYVAVDTVFYDGFAPASPFNSRLSHLAGAKSELIDLAGAIIGGALRVLTIVFTVLVLLSPWGIEFGNLNPFEDVFFGVRFGDLRSWIGAAGVAIVLFSVGLLGAKLFVSWLDQQLLPRTALTMGVRHSVTTIAGYIGFILALTIALSQAGVQLQNVALVAGALSVGVGFGLQQVVSNFVAGLIVLAERPIRMGDVIQVRGEEGKVMKINVRATELLLGDHSTVIVPNADIISSVVKNRTFNDATHQVALRFVTTHKSDIARFKQILITIAASNPMVVMTKAPAVYVKDVTESGVEVELSVRCNDVANMKKLRSDLYVEALAAIRDSGIELSVATG